MYVPFVGFWQIWVDLLCSLCFVFCSHWLLSHIIFKLKSKSTLLRPMTSILSQPVFLAQAILHRRIVSICFNRLIVFLAYYFLLTPNLHCLSKKGLMVLPTKDQSAKLKQHCKTNSRTKKICFLCKFSCNIKKVFLYPVNSKFIALGVTIMLVRRNVICANAILNFMAILSAIDESQRFSN